MVDSKKGQQTLGIALGLMLLFSVGALVVFKGIGTDFGNINPFTEQLPVDVQPIKQFVEDCIKSVAEDGLRMLGQQGGYIDTVGEGIVIQNENPTDEVGVKFPAIDSGVDVPYWYFLESPNSKRGLYKLSGRLTPSEDLITSHLRRYIRNNLRTCTLQRFEQFAKFTITDATPVPEVSIGTSNVHLNVVYPINISTDTRKHQIDKFFITLDLNLKAILAAARDIAKTQAEYSFLEYNDMELIATYSDIDGSLLPPPSSQTEMGLKNIVWSALDVKNKVQGLLQNKYPLLQADPSLNKVRVEADTSIPFSATAQAIYDKMIIPFSKTGGYNVNFHYSDWPIYLAIDNGASMTKPEQLMPQIPLIGSLINMEKYKTIYDISHPVVVEIEDPSAFKGEGYLFRFALEANIRGNTPLKFTEESEYNPFVSDVIESSLLCEPNQRNSGEVWITLKDAVSKKPISGVQVYFIAGDECYLGVTDENGDYRAQFPVGLGVLNLVDGAGNHMTLTLPDFETKLLTFKRIEREMQPIKSKKITAKVVEVQKQGRAAPWTIVGTKDIGENQTVLVTFTKKKEYEREPDFSKVASLSEDIREVDVELAPGEYDVKVVMLYFGNATISPDSRRTKVRSFPKKYKEYWLPGPEPMIVPIPAVEQDISFEVTAADMQSIEPLTFYGLFVNMKDSSGLVIEDLGIFENAAAQFASVLVPRR